MRRLFPILALLACALPARAVTPTSIKFVGGCAAATTTCTAPTVAVGDYMHVFAFRSAITAPSLPAGWTTIQTASASSSSFREGCHVATTISDATGTWTNATSVTLVVYRGTQATSTATCLTQGIGGKANASSTTSTISYTGITFTDTSGLSVLIGASGSSVATCTPAGMSSVEAQTTVNITNDAEGASAWSTTTCTGSTGNSKTAVAELLAARPFARWSPTDYLAVVDCYVDLADTTHADGTTFTTAILLPGTHGACATGTEWSLSAAPPPGLTLNKPTRYRKFDLYVRGDNFYKAGGPQHRSIQINHNTGQAVLTSVILNLPTSTIPSVTTCQGFTSGVPANVTLTGSSLLDIIRIPANLSGGLAVMQINQNLTGAGSPPFLYTMGIESGLTGSTVHSNYFQILPGEPLWTCFYANIATGVIRLSAWDMATGALIGEASLNQTVTPDTIGSIQYGQEEAGICTGTCNSYSYLEDIVLDWTTARFPIGPGNYSRPIRKATIAATTMLQRKRAF